MFKYVLSAIALAATNASAYTDVTDALNRQYEIFECQLDNGDYFRMTNRDGFLQYNIDIHNKDKGTTWNFRYPEKPDNKLLHIDARYGNDERYGYRDCIFVSFMGGGDNKKGVMKVTLDTTAIHQLHTNDNPNWKTGRGMIEYYDGNKLVNRMMCKNDVHFAWELRYLIKSEQLKPGFTMDYISYKDGEKVHLPSF